MAIGVIAGKKKLEKCEITGKKYSILGQPPRKRSGTRHSEDFGKGNHGRGPHRRKGGKGKPKKPRGPLSKGPPKADLLRLQRELLARKIDELKCYLESLAKEVGYPQGQEKQ